MERKGGSTMVAVAKEEVQAALAKAHTLTSEEEKALRMRHGAAAPDLHAPLPKAAGGNRELSDELLLMEMQLMRAYRARALAQTRPIGARNATKERIVRALRKKR